MYKIVRMHQNESPRGFRRTIKTGLTLKEAQAHCQDPETSSRTCTRAENKRITREGGPWFDGYEEQNA
jgi:hypothetical protein